MDEMTKRVDADGTERTVAAPTETPEAARKVCTMAAPGRDPLDEMTDAVAGDGLLYSAHAGPGTALIETDRVGVGLVVEKVPVERVSAEESILLGEQQKGLVRGFNVYVHRDDVGGGAGGAS